MIKLENDLKVREKDIDQKIKDYEQKIEEQKKLEEQRKLEEQENERKKQEEIKQQEEQKKLEEAQKQEAIQQTTTTATPQQNLNFRNCKEAKAAGYSNIRRGEPGYSSRLDRDGDGLACDK